MYFSFRFCDADFSNFTTRSQANWYQILLKTYAKHLMLESIQSENEKSPTVIVIIKETINSSIYLFVKITEDYKFKWCMFLARTALTGYNSIPSNKKWQWALSILYTSFLLTVIILSCWWSEKSIKRALTDKMHITWR